MKLKIALFSLLGAVAAAGFAFQAERYDIIIKNAKVIDGSGNPWYAADVAIRDGRVAAIGKQILAPAATAIDARGMAVTPGFIDMHGHSDYTLLRDGNAESKIRQGITVELIGESASVAPRKPSMDGELQREKITERWTTFRQYFDIVNKKGASVNLMSYVAAGQLRRMVIGDDFRKPSSAEMEQMRSLARQAMEDGAIGLVSRLETPEGGEENESVADTEELVELAKVVSEYGGIFGSHMRNQTDQFIQSIQETGLIGDKGNLVAEIFHIKSAGKPYFGQMDKALATIEEYRRRGIDLGADVYPYIAASHGLATEVPSWAKNGGNAKFVERLKDQSLRPRLRKEIDGYILTKYYNEEKKVGGYDAVLIASTTKPNDPNTGKTIAQIAADRKISGADAVMDLLIENNGNVSIVMFYMSESDLRKAIAYPLVSFCTDGSSMSPAFGGQPHPRSYGTFPRVLGKYVREEKILRLEDAVRKMTSLPAQRLGLRDRGTLRVGNWADVVIFDPDRVADRATFDNPHQYPVGIEYVLVNGKVVIEKGNHTGAHPGRALYGPGRK